MINLEDDRLSFTFPEIARQLRARVGRQIAHILPEFLRPEERTALLAERDRSRPARHPKIAVGKRVAAGLSIPHACCRPT